MDQIRPPDPLDFTKANSRCSEWKRRFERFRIATKLFKEDDVIQISTLLYTIGRESEYVFTQFAFDEKKARDYTFVVGMQIWWTFHTRKEYSSWASNVSSKISKQSRISRSLHVKPTYEACIRWPSIAISGERHLYSREISKRSSWQKFMKTPTYERRTDACRMCKDGETVRSYTRSFQAKSNGNGEVFRSK